MRRSIPLVLTSFAIVLAAACGSVTEVKDGSGQGGTSGHAGSGAGGNAGTTGQAGSTAGTTGQGGTTGQAGSGPGGGGTTGGAGTTGSAGRGGTTGAAGTTGSAGRGGTTGSAGRGGTTGSAGTSGSAGRGGQGGQNDGGLSCSELEAEYSKAVQEARACTPDAAGQCQQLVDTGLGCPQCQVRVTDTKGPDAIRAMWNKAGCTPPIFCPAIICVVPGPGMCTRSDASGTGAICTMQSGGVGPL